MTVQTTPTPTPAPVRPSDELCHVFCDRHRVAFCGLVPNAGDSWAPDDVPVSCVVCLDEHDRTADTHKCPRDGQTCSCWSDQ